MDHLAWLGAWYAEQCDGCWEHTRGLRLEPVEAGGPERDRLRLTIELVGTGSAESRPRSLLVTSTRGEQLRCTLTAERFQGEGDAENLEQVIGVFRCWVEGVEQASPAGAAACWALAEVGV